MSCQQLQGRQYFFNQNKCSIRVRRNIKSRIIDHKTHDFFFVKTLHVGDACMVTATQSEKHRAVRENKFTAVQQQVGGLPMRWLADYLAMHYFSKRFHCIVDGYIQGVYYLC